MRCRAAAYGSCVVNLTTLTSLLPGSLQQLCGDVASPCMPIMMARLTCVPGGE